MAHDVIAQFYEKEKQRNRNWYRNNLLRVLELQKEKHVRDVDVSIRLAKELMKLLEEPLEKQKTVHLRKLVPYNDVNMMKPIEPYVQDILYKSTEKGASERYLKERNKKAPEEKFYFRAASSWDYGWQQKQSHMRGLEPIRGRRRVLRDTFYRKNNLAPDPPTYTRPTTGQFSTCSEYHCSAN